MRTTDWLKGAAMATALVALTGASAPKSGYDPAETFAPLDLGQGVNVYRSSSGVPGPQYWQNKADYQIHTTLDPAAKTLTATEQITYTNNSPDALDVLWLQIEQNAYKTESRGHLSSGGPIPGTTEGMIFDAVQVSVAGGPTTTVTPLVSDTMNALPLGRIHGFSTGVSVSR